nr:hypothetical protein [Tanacetum cinerariifolium]
MEASQKKPKAQWTSDERKAANLDQSLKSLIMVMDLKLCYNTFSKKDFQDSVDDEEDKRSSHDYLKNLEEEYQARSLLAKSKRFFKKGKNKGLIAETYDWDDEEVSSDENEVTEVKALMALTDEERVSVGKKVPEMVI